MNTIRKSLTLRTRNMKQLFCVASLATPAQKNLNLIFSTHAKKQFLNLVESHQILIVDTLFRLIWHQMEFRLVPNQLKNWKKNYLILAWFNKVQKKILSMRSPKKLKFDCLAQLGGFRGNFEALSQVRICRPPLPPQKWSGFLWMMWNGLKRMKNQFSNFYDFYFLNYDEN